MIICHCRLATDRDVRTAVAEGARSLDDVARACGAGSDCGNCRPEVERLIAAATLVARRRPVVVAELEVASAV